MIVPDLPLEEQGPNREALGRRGLALIPLVATPAGGRARICTEAEGFVYLVSTVGVTGKRQQLPPELAELIAASKREASVPFAVGFGISTPDQAATVDGSPTAIIGTRLVVADAADRERAVAAVGEKLARPRRGTRRIGFRACRCSSSSRFSAAAWRWSRLHRVFPGQSADCLPRRVLAGALLRVGAPEI